MTLAEQSNLHAGHFREWLMQGHYKPAEGPSVREQPGHTHAWWKVMCLTGVDYFSTLGYQPGIAALAAGRSRRSRRWCWCWSRSSARCRCTSGSPAESPHGDGSISMLERLLTWWQGKLLRAGADRLRRDRLHHHDHALGRRRDRPRRREPDLPAVLAWLRGAGHAGADRAAWRRLPARVSARRSASRSALVAVYSC